MEVTYLVIRENVRIDIAVLLVYIKNKITFNLARTLRSDEKNKTVNALFSNELIFMVMQGNQHNNESNYCQERTFE